MKSIIFAALILSAVSFPQKSSEIFSIVVTVANKVVVERVADMPQVKEAVMKKVNVGVKGEV
jgi:parvulin-like peptidyl-prolyl isomerase